MEPSKDELLWKRYIRARDLRPGGAGGGKESEKMRVENENKKRSGPTPQNAKYSGGTRVDPRLTKNTPRETEREKIGSAEKSVQHTHLQWEGSV